MTEIAFGEEEDKRGREEFFGETGENKEGRKGEEGGGRVDGLFLPW